MAFNVSFIYQIIDKYSSKLRRIAASTQNFKTVADRLSKGINRSFSRSIKGVDTLSHKLRGLANKQNIIASAGAAMALAFPINQAMSFETAIGNLDKKFEFGSFAARKDFIQQLGQMGSNIGFNATEMANLAFEAGKLNIPLSEIQDFVNLSAKASVALDGLGIEEAGQIIGDLKNKFSLGIDGVEGMLDAINILADNTTANGGQILNVTGRLSQSFSALKLPPELAAGFAAFSRQISESDELAASGFRQFINNLLEAGYQSKLQADSIGAIGEVIKKINAIPAAKRGAAIIEQFGRENAPFVMQLADKFDLLKDTIGKVTDKTKVLGSMNAEFQRAQQNTANKLEIVKAKFNNLVITLGTKLLPTVNRILTALAPLVDKAIAWVDQNPKLAKWGAIIALAVPLVVAIGAGIGLVLAAVAPLAAAFGAVVTVVSAIGAAMAAVLGPVGAVIAAVAAVGAAIWAWGDDIGGVIGAIRDKLAPFFEWVGGLWDGLGGAISYTADLLGLSGGPEAPTITEAPAGTGVATTALIERQGGRLDGSIGIAIDGPGKVKKAAMKSDQPGNLGFNVAGATN